MSLRSLKLLRESGESSAKKLTKKHPKKDHQLVPIVLFFNFSLIPKKTSKGLEFGNFFYVCPGAAASVVAECFVSAVDPVWMYLFFRDASPQNGSSDFDCNRPKKKLKSWNVQSRLCRNLHEKESKSCDRSQKSPESLHTIIARAQIGNTSRGEDKK